jgi:D-alanyl-D-alanine carboxypeptidase
MQLRLIQIYSTLFLILVFYSCSDTNSIIPIEEDLIEKQLQEIINSKIGVDKLVGVSVSIRVGKTERWNLVGGNSKDREPINRNMRFGIASITKTAVAATILKLEEEGLLTLDDPINKWLTLNNNNVDDNITIFQLLNHLTGVKGYFQHPDIWPRVEGNLDVAIPSVELVRFIGEPLFAPGLKYEYSNSNYLLLGLIIEVVSGQSVGDAMRSRFWNRLQLRHIYFGDDEAPTGPVTVPWRDGDGDGVLEDISSEYRAAYHSVFFTAADIFSTSEDLSMWTQHLYNGDAISEVSRDKMLDFLFIDSGSPFWNGYGLGVRRIIIAGRTLWGHTGGMRGYGSYMLYDPVSNMSIAVLNNQSRSENGPVLRFELVEEILKVVFKEI